MNRAKFVTKLGSYKAVVKLTHPPIEERFPRRTTKGRAGMPDKTADALERILSLSSKSSAPAPASALSADPADHDAPPTAGPSDAQAEGHGGHVFGAVLPAVFFEFIDEHAEGAGVGPVMSGPASWIAEPSPAVLDSTMLDDDASPWNAHGPSTYGAPHVDPYGPADKDEEAGAGPELTDIDRDAGAGPCQSRAWEKEAQESTQGAPDGNEFTRPEDKPALPGLDPSSAASQSIPYWTYEKLPRECLLVLLESALKHMPQTADVVDRCMQVLSPLSAEEHSICFGSNPTCSTQAARDEVASGLESAGEGLVGRESGRETARNRFPAVECTRPASSGAVWSAVDDPWHGMGRMQGLAREDEDEVQEMQPEESKPELKKECQSSTCVDVRAGMASNSAGAQARERSGPASKDAPAGAVEGHRTIKKAGARAAIRLTESRAGTRTSILTEEQAIQVFKQRPMQRSARALLCSQLAEHYGVTTTAIRHIWDRRTWVHTNLPFWNDEELAASLAEGTCEDCRTHKKVERIEDTCEHCPINRKRGRPRGARDSCRRVRKNP